MPIIRRWFLLAPGGEWTVEANPGTLDAEKADVLAEAGVERVSLGAQSFQPDSSGSWSGTTPGRGRAGRRADPARDFARWSLDLIFGVPGSTLERLAARPGDRLGVRAVAPLLLRAGVREGDRPLEAMAGRPGRPRRRGARAVDVRVRPSTGSTEPGLAMYEISNFARPGHESRHNLVYWANDAYFGFGLGAARYVRGRAIGQHARHAAYLRRIEAGEPATGPTEELTPEEQGARDGGAHAPPDRPGIDRDDFRRRTGFDFDRLARAGIERYGARGYLEDDGVRRAAQPRRDLPRRPGPGRVPLSRSVRVPSGSDSQLLRSCRRGRRA